MTEVSLYHLTISSVEKALPKVLEKVYGAGKRATVLASSEERVESLANALWTYTPASFLPHGTKKDGFAERQPIWLTTELERPNGATVLVLSDNVTIPPLQDFERCIDIFDGADEAALQLARTRYQTYCQQGHSVTYWEQGLKGNWDKKTLT
jgi:DNA polymerase-3 subunit chi